MSLDKVLDFLEKNSFIEAGDARLSRIQKATEIVRLSRELGDFIEVGFKDFATGGGRSFPRHTCRCVYPL